MEADLLRARIRERLAATGKKPVTVAVAVGKGRDYLRDFLNGDKNSLATDVLMRLAAELDCSVEYLMDAGAAAPGAALERMVPIIGRVGADAEGRVLFSTGQDTGDETPIPPGGTSKARGLYVRGHSMKGVADDGAIIYFEDQKTPPTEDLLTYPCVVETEDGEVLVKRLLHGSVPGLYNLESINGPTLRDKRLRWAAEITAVIPPRQARRIVRGAGERAA